MRTRCCDHAEAASEVRARDPLRHRYHAAGSRRESQGQGARRPLPGHGSGCGPGPPPTSHCKVYGSCSDAFPRRGATAQWGKHGFNVSCAPH